MRFINYSTIILIFFTVLIGCKKNKTIEVVNWSNSRLLEIPQKVRFQQYQKGNLVINPSFEERKLIKFDSLNYTYNISYWKKEGFNINYIDRKVDSLLPYEVVSDGLRSIEISRSEANEYMEAGDGVTSDFIKVIPGMYDLYLDIKCKDIKPNSQRFNKFLNDAVDIRLLYFDRNKIPVVSQTYHPGINKIIDNSFKGFSFSHFEQIDSTYWCTVKGISGYYPFNESIIPDDAKFVKIYIGLKGTGKIYIDNVRLFYSKENLTPRERSEIYFDSISVNTGLIIPTPQYITFIDSFYYFNPDSGLNLEPYILISKNINENLPAVSILKNKLIKIFSASRFKFDINNIKTGTVVPENYKKNSLIISIGNTDLLQNHIDDSVYTILDKHKNESYYIDFIKDSLSVLFIYGLNDKSLYYATETALQLFQGFKLLSCRIIDYPYFHNRSILTESVIITNELSEFITKYRINEIYKPGDPVNNNYLSSYPSLSYDNLVLPASMAKKNKALFKDENNYVVPDIENVTAISKKHNKVLKNLYSKGFKVYFLSPYYCNNNIIENTEICKFYFHNLTIRKNIEFIWYGANYNSQYFDDIQMEFFKSFTGKYPIAVDNSQDTKSPSLKLNKYYTYYPEKIVMGNIYDPYDNKMLINKHTSTMLQINTRDIFSNFRIATFGDYLWNPKEYNPDLSLYKVLVNEFGLNTAKYFYYYNDAYCGLLSTINTIINEGSTNKTLKSSEKEIVMLNIAYEEIKKSIPHHKDIIDELYILKIMIVNKYNTVYEKALIDKKMKEDSLISNNFIP